MPVEMFALRERFTTRNRVDFPSLTGLRQDASGHETVGSGYDQFFSGGHLGCASARVTDSSRSRFAAREHNYITHHFKRGAIVGWPNSRPKPSHVTDTKIKLKLPRHNGVSVEALLWRT